MKRLLLLLLLLLTPAAHAAEIKTWLLLSFDRKGGGISISHELITMDSLEHCEVEGERISSKFRHVRTEFICVTSNSVAD